MRKDNREVKERKKKLTKGILYCRHCIEPLLTQNVVVDVGGLVTYGRSLELRYCNNDECKFFGVLTLSHK